MTRFVDLPTPEGETTWVNPDQVVSVSEHERNGQPVTFLLLPNGHTRVVSGSVEQTLGRLQDESA